MASGRYEVAVHLQAVPHWTLWRREVINCAPAGRAHLRPSLQAHARAIAAILAALRKSHRPRHHGGTRGHPWSTSAHDRERELTPAGLLELDQLLKPLVWFERRRRDRLGKAVIAEADETQPLVSSAKGGKKVQRENGGLSGMRKSMGAIAGSVAYITADAFGSGPQRPNPIGEDRKRLGFLIVADLGSRSSFDTAHAIVDRIFARLQFDTNDPMTCPVAVIIVGNKSDLRGRHREMEEEEALRKEILHRYENRHASPPHNVLYVECSAQTNSGLDAVSERCLPNGPALRALQNNLLSRQ